MARTYVKWSENQSEQLIKHASRFTLAMASTTTLKDYINKFEHPDDNKGTAAHNRWTTLIKIDDNATAVHERIIGLIKKSKMIKNSQTKGNLTDKPRKIEKTKPATIPSPVAKNEEGMDTVVGIFQKAFLRQPKKVEIEKLEKTNDKITLTNVSIIFSLALTLIMLM